VWSPAPTMDLTDPLDQLATVMHQAGIVNGNGGNGNGKGNGHRRAGSTAGRQSAGPGSTAAGGDDPAVALAELRETLERAGIWRR
jgi:hypothetical protein